MKALEHGELEIILRVISEGVQHNIAQRDTAAILLMHDAGLRVQEACLVAYTDLSPDQRFLNVRGEIAKWRKPGDDQIVSVSTRLATAITDWMRMRGREPGTMLTTRTGSPVHPHHYNHLLARISSRYLDRHVHPHMLRHSCGTVLACDAKLPLPVTKEQMRHRNIATTNAYLSVRPTWGGDVAAAFG